MNKRIILILSFALFNSVLIKAQEYALWFTSKKFIREKSVRGENYEYLFRVGALDNLGNVVMSFPWLTEEPAGVFNVNASSLPLTLVINSKISNANGSCSYNNSHEANEFQYLIAGNNGTIGLTSPPPENIECVEIVSGNPDELLRYHFLSIVLPHYVQPADNNRSLEDFLFFTPENTFTNPTIKIPEVIWQYDYNNMGFKDFPESIKNNFPMKSKVGEILVNETIERNKSLRVRAVLDTSIYMVGGKILPIVYSHTINFNTILSSPLFESINEENTTCNYGVNGGFTLNVKRDLNNGEELVITLYDANNDALIGQEFTTSLTNNNDGTFAYTWSQSLDAGNYKIKYQSHGGTGGISPMDSTWNSLNFSDPFQIKKPAKVEFTITGQSEETCFDENDGYIDVEATREGNRTLFYQLIKNGTVQIFNGTKWVNYTGTNAQNETFNSFISNTTTRISKLGKGTYRVKVRDSHECYMRTN